GAGQAVHRPSYRAVGTESRTRRADRSASECNAQSTQIRRMPLLIAMATRELGLFDGYSARARVSRLLSIGSHRAAGGGIFPAVGLQYRHEQVQTDAERATGARYAVGRGAPGRRH